jgi:hypothetical protein
METTTFIKNFSFIDAENKTVFIELRIENNRLSICGNTQGSGGQIVDSIKPANKFQERLIEIWRAYHLNDMHAGTEEQEAALQSEEFTAFKEKIKTLLDKAKVIENIVTGSFEKYAEFIGVPSSFVSAKNDFINLQKVWNGEKVMLGYRSTTDFFTVVKSFPPKLQPKFIWNSHVPPNEVKELFGDDYTQKIEFLKSVNLYEVPHPETGEPYRYGHAWLKRALPTGIIDELNTLIADGEEFHGSSYEKQANDFLIKYGITFSAKFKKTAKYFPDDEQERDIYTCKFKRAEGWFSITFGQSLANAGKSPTAYDVLTCLTKSDPGSFEDFCDNCGYDTDSRKAMKIYKSVYKEWLKVGAFFTEEELNELHDIN